MTLKRNQIITWVGLFLTLLLAWFLRSVLAYFLVALIVAFIGAPLKKFFDKYIRFRGNPVPSGISATLVLLTFIMIFALFLYAILPPLIEQVNTLRAISRSQLDRSFATPLNDLKKWCENIGIPTENLNIEYFKTQFRSMLDLGKLSTLAGDIVSGTSSVIGWLFIVTFISFFLLKEKFLFYRILHTLTPARHEHKMQRIMRNLNNMLGRYFRSLLLQILVYGVYIFVGLSIAGEKYALTVAIFSGLVNLISYIGPLLAVSFALLFSVFSHIGADFYLVILPELYQVLLVYLVAILLDNFFSYPLIFSNSLKIHPLELFFCILAGAQLGGLLGMMVAAPLYTVLRILAKETLSEFEIVQNITRKI